MRKLLILPIIVILFGCSQKKEQSIFNKWKITKCSKIDSINQLDNYIDLSQKDKGVASVGCNTLTFNYMHSEGKIGIKEVFSTRMYCQELDTIEKSLIDLLKQVSTYKTDGNSLTLIGEDVSIECSLIK